MIDDARELKRLVGLTPPGVVVTDEHGKRRGKLSGVLDALERRYEIAAILAPRRPRSRYVAALAERFEWGENRAERFRRWTAESGRLLDEFEQPYDLIFQLGMLLAPGPDYHRRKYVVYADNTLALTLKHYPQWWPSDGPANVESLEYERQTSTSAALVLTFSEWARESMIDDYGCLPDRVVVVGGASASAPPRNAGWDSPVALFVGNDFERKGGRVLLSAWPKVRKRVPDAELWVVGPRRKRATVDGVRWLGRVRPNEVAPLRERASVFVLPSLFDPCPHVFYEAMSAALPSIGTTVCAIPEIVTHEETGLLVGPGNEDELTDALVRLFQDHALAERMGRAAAADYGDRGSWDHVAARIEAAIARGADSPEGSAPTPQRAS
jgi:glycosyltransferase involved in cell wall biosynthesis